ncbi:MAG TPA: acyltransferase [Pyrinomonadaceae bacterium]|nr:acyltransferase [Pyrinomonadaceae bacterium]
MSEDRSPTVAGTSNFGSPSNRLLSIDALRGIAALGVVLYHAVHQTASAVPANLFQYPVRLIQFLSSFGYIGVFLFFVISGFCIHLQWAKARAGGQDHPVKFGAFWRRRLRRLYPPYLIALAVYLVITAFTAGIDVTHFFVYDVVMHLLMLHNLDPQTCYSINGVFWTLAIEEQLYLAYFLLLFLRMRWGWGPTLLICGLARLGWFGLSHLVWLKSGIGIPVPEGAASHWFTWALGAIAVEAAFGLVKIPKWCRNIWLGGIAVVIASIVSTALPNMQKDTFVHTTAWLLMHPLWGFGFFVVVNRFVHVEQSWQGALSKPRLVAGFAAIGVFSYSLYLTHELVIMQSYWLVFKSLPAMVNTFLVVTPATIFFAWLFYLFCEKPYMRKKLSSSEFPVSSSEVPVSSSEFPVPRSEFGVTGLTLEATESEL